MELGDDGGEDGDGGSDDFDEVDDEEEEEEGEVVEIGVSELILLSLLVMSPNFGTEVCGVASTLGATFLIRLVLTDTRPNRRELMSYCGVVPNAYLRCCKKVKTSYAPPSVNTSVSGRENNN